MKQQVGLRVKNARKSKGLTQSELAEAIDKTFETVSNIERGKTAPNFQTLFEISQVLEVPMKDFFDDEGKGVSRQRAELLEEGKTLMGDMNDEQLKMWNQMAKVLLKRELE